jgi:alpha-L-arabinofuranosidase
VRQTIPGNGEAGWAVNQYADGTVSTETTDLSPETLGQQAVLLNAYGPNQVAAVDSYFDSTNTHNFVLINGSYQITFRAKGAGGNDQLNVSFGRLISNGNYCNQTLTLTPTWQDYTLTFTGAETASTAAGTLDLHFAASGGEALLDDVSLSAVTGSSNTTAFRDEVVSTLAALHPGTLRYMDGLPDFGSSIDNMIAPVSARVRTGSSTQQTESDDIAMGLHEFLQLCQAVGAEPWYNLPPGISTTEMQHLIQYFAGDARTVYGAKRAALGQTAPWTSVFPVIHLELGNEEWNYGTFPGNAMNDPVAYAKRVTTVFGAARNAQGYRANHFDLIMGSFVVNSWYTGQEVANGANYDSISVAPYLFGTFSDASSNEAIFGPMFAEPEMWDSTASGYMMQQAQAVAPSGKKLVTYEENISTQSGTASQDSVNMTVPSVGAGVMMADHMLLQMRDLAIQTQNVWALPGYQNQFNNSNGGSETSPIFGTVVDMGGAANRVRPVYLAAQLVNTAVLAKMLGTTVTGANPTWNQAASSNDSVQLNNAHYLQFFAFTDGVNARSVVVVNLSRSVALPVTFSGANAPVGQVSIGQLTSANLTDSNEAEENVAITNTTSTAFVPSAAVSLPPFSVTVFRWQTK